jgi:hypothetical protein
MPTAFVTRDRVPSLRKELLVGGVSETAFAPIGAVLEGGDQGGGPPPPQGPGPNQPGNAGSDSSGSTRHPIQPKHHAAGPAIAPYDAEAHKTRPYKASTAAHPTAALRALGHRSAGGIVPESHRANGMPAERERWRSVARPIRSGYVTGPLRLGFAAASVSRHAPSESRRIGPSYGRGSRSNYGLHALGVGHWLHHEIEKHVVKPVEKHIVKPVERHVIRPLVKETRAAERRLKVSLHHLERTLAHHLPQIERDLKHVLPHLEREVKRELPHLTRTLQRDLPSAKDIAVASGLLASITQVAAIATPPPADAAFETVSLAMTGVNLVAAGIDADKHSANPSKLVDFLVAAAISRAGVSGSDRTVEEKEVRAAAALIARMYYDYRRQH